MQRIRSVCRLLSLTLIFSAALLSQTVSTQIVGLVTDPTGAVIPGAEVKATRVATGDVRTTTTNETGNFVFPLLDVGEYTVSCSAAGFKTEVRRDITLQLQQRLRIDFQLQIGDQVETIEVTGAIPLLRTEDATLGSVVEHKRVVDLPLNGRNFAQAATLMPGVVFGVSRMGQDGQQTIGNLAMPGQIVGISANGQRDANQNVTLDGVVATDSHHSAMLFVPSLDAVEEFKIQSAVYSAEYGMNSGAQANVAVRSGGNDLHGTLFHFIRNDKLDARGFFSDPEADKNRLRRNQYGGVVSGPFVKDMTFWLFSFEGRRERRGTPARMTVPTLEMRGGDFSEFLIPNNRWYPNDSNPLATRAIGLPGSQDKFPNNIIPQSLISPVSTNLLTWQETSPFAQGGFMPFPSHEAQSRANNSPFNLLGTNDQELDSDQYLTRIDHRFSDNDRMFGRYVIVESVWVQNPLQRTTYRPTDYRAQNAGIGYSKIISPTVVNDLRFGLNRIRAVSSGLQTDTGFTHRDLGFDFRVIGDGNRTLTEFEEGLPSIGITGWAGIASGASGYSVKSVYEFNDSLSWNRGKHNFKFGGQYRWNTVDFGGANLQRGQLSFTRDITGIPDAFAAFMLGYPLNSRSAEGVPPGFMRQHKTGLFWLDDWKATPKLTINYGVRWDYYGVVTDKEGKIRNLSFENDKVQIINGIEVPMLTPNPNVSESLYDTNWKQFMPRLGIAYRLSDTLVIRTGAGLFYNAQQTNNFSILTLSPPFSGSAIFQQEDRANPNLTIDNPFAGSATEGIPQALIMLGYLQADRNNRSGYLNNHIWQWNFEVEKSLGQDQVFGVAYVGSAASHIDMPAQNANNPDPGPGSVQARRPTPFYVDSRDPNTLLPLSTIRRLESSVNTNYNALQARFERRYSKGLLFNASFNYQKAMGIGYGANEGGGFGTRATQDPRDRQADYARSNIDQRFRFVFSHIYELPWLRDAGGFKGALLGGWAVNGIISLTSGLPVLVNQSGDSHNTGAQSAQRPHIVPGGVVERVMEGRTIDRWFNTDAFVRSVYEGSPTPGLFIGPKGYGNAGPALFDAPAVKTWDFALFKEFQITESQKIQFRYEAFNFLNSPQFNAPARSLGGATFGSIGGTVVNNREMQFALKYMF